MGDLPKYDASILVVEDVEMMREIEKGLLSLFNCEIEFVTDGNEAIEVFKQNSYDLVFMDIQLPGKNGFEVTRAFRKMEEENNKAPIPIIGITASTLSTEQQSPDYAGLNECLSKPVDLQTFEQTLSKYLSHKRVQG